MSIHEECGVFGVFAEKLIERTRGRSFCLVLPLFPANTLNHSFTDSGKP